MNFGLLRFRMRTSLNGFFKFVIHGLGTLIISPFIRSGHRKVFQTDTSPIRILYICLAFRGDLILNFAAIKAIKRMFPDSKITCWVMNYNLDLAKLNPDISDVIACDDFPLSGIGFLLRPMTVTQNRPFIDRIRRGKFDICIDDSGCVFSSVVSFMSGIPFRIGRNGQGFGFLYHHEYAYDFNAQLIEKRLRLLKPLGVRNLSADELYPTITIPRAMLSPVIDKCGLRDGENKYMTIQPFGGWASKNWEIAKFARVIDEFTLKTGLLPIFVGSADESSGISEITVGIRAQSTNAAGRLSLVESAILISGAQMHLGVDSFGAHFAAAAGIASLTIFGPTNAVLSAYLGPKNIAVIKKTRCTPPDNRIYCCPDAGRSCKRLSCMSELRAEDVLRVLTDLWEGKSLEKVVVF